MNDISSQFLPATFIKRLMAIIYDLLLLTAILFAAGILIATITTFIVNDGNAITEDHPFFQLYQVYLLVWLFIVSFIFFGWFWTHGGQTLGMKTWKMRLITLDGNTISWKQAGIRFLAAIFSWLFFGIGFLWILFAADKRAWHDILSKTVVVQVEITK